MELTENALEKMRDDVFIESDPSDLIFDLAWRVLTDAADDLSDSQERFDELMESPHFQSELEAMTSRILDAVQPRRCVCCGDLAIPAWPGPKRIFYQVIRFFRRIWRTRWL